MVWRPPGPAAVRARVVSSPPIRFGRRWGRRASDSLPGRAATAPVRWWRRRRAVPTVAAGQLLAADDAGDRARDGVLLVDVRDDAEWSRERAEGATHMQMWTLRRQAAGIPRDARVVVMCQNGNRSPAATRLLRAMGFDAAMLAGGLDAWRAQGGAMVASPASTTDG